MTLIREHGHDPTVDVTWLSQRLFVSRRQLDRAFLGGPTVAEEIARQRIASARHLATQLPNASVAEIARRAGYITYETFRAQCRRYLRRSPTTVLRGVERQVYRHESIDLPR